MKKNYDGIEEIEMHYQDEPEKHLGSISVPIYQTSLFSRKTGNLGYKYTRISNPTIEVPEKKIAKMEKGEGALLFSSGMAAITAAIMHYVKADSHIVCVQDVYLTTDYFISRYLKDKFNVESTFFKAPDFNEFIQAITDKTDIIFLETCVSNVFSFPDIEKICQVAKEKNIKVIIDNTYASPLFCNPLELGVDIVIHSCSKYIGGHSDIIGGVLISDNKTVEEIRNTERSMYGACIDPHQAWMVLRSLRTLNLRMEKHMDNGMILAEYLEQSPYIEEVIHPGVKSHPQHEYAEKILKGYPSLFCFVPVGGEDKAKELYKYLKYPERGPSWGGFETLMNTPGFGITEERRKRTSIKTGAIRISVGLENIQMLIDDFNQAMLKTYK